MKRRTPADTVSLSEASDDALVDRFKGGDKSAFDGIFERHRPRIFTITLSLLRNHADAEEVTQDVFIRAHKGLLSFRGDSSLATWLYRIAINLVKNKYWYFFRRRRHDSLSLDFPLTEESPATFADLVADTIQDPAQEAVMNEFSTRMTECMERLDSRKREILVLRVVLDRSYEEIADTLGIEVGTVKSRIARARGCLRTLLAESYGDQDGAIDLYDTLHLRRQSSKVDIVTP